MQEATRLRVEEPAGRRTSRERGVVGEHRARADEDRVAGRSHRHRRNSRGDEAGSAGGMLLAFVLTSGIQQAAFAVDQPLKSYSGGLGFLAAQPSHIHLAEVEYAGLGAI